MSRVRLMAVGLDIEFRVGANGAGFIIWDVYIVRFGLWEGI